MFKNLPLSTCLSFVLAGIFLFHGNEMIAQENSKTSTFNNDQLSWNPCPSFMPEGCEIAILNGDVTKSNLDVFFKVPGGYEIPNHYHTSPERMMLVSGKLAVTYAGEKTSTMTVGTYAYGPPEKPHVAVCAPGDPCILFIAFEEPLDAFPFKTQH